MYVSLQDIVIREQVNTRPDVIRQVIYKNKEQDPSYDWSLGYIW